MVYLNRIGNTLKKKINFTGKGIKQIDLYCDYQQTLSYSNAFKISFYSDDTLCKNQVITPGLTSGLVSISKGNQSIPIQLETNGSWSNYSIATNAFNDDSPYGWMGGSTNAYAYKPSLFRMIFGTNTFTITDLSLNIEYYNTTEFYTMTITYDDDTQMIENIYKQIDIGTGKINLHPEYLEPEAKTFNKILIECENPCYSSNNYYTTGNNMKIYNNDKNYEITINKVYNTYSGWQSNNEGTINLNNNIINFHCSGSNIETIAFTGHPIFIFDENIYYAAHTNDINNINRWQAEFESPIISDLITFKTVNGTNYRISLFLNNEKIYSNLYFDFVEKFPQNYSEYYGTTVNMPFYKDIIE